MKIKIGIIGDKNVYRISNYKVRGDHPLFKRPDKTGMKFDEAEEYAEELADAGYENIVIREENDNE